MYYARNPCQKSEKTREREGENLTESLKTAFVLWMPPAFPNGNRGLNSTVRRQKYLITDTRDRMPFRCKVPGGPYLYSPHKGFSSRGGPAHTARYAAASLRLRLIAALVLPPFNLRGGYLQIIRNMCRMQCVCLQTKKNMAEAELFAGNFVYKDRWRRGRPPKGG